MIRELVSFGLRACVVASALALFENVAQAADPPPTPPWESPLVFVTDPRFGMEAGLRSVDSLGRVFFRYDQALPPLVRWDETRGSGRAAAIVSRVAQLVFVDVTLASFEVTVIHELFGHGSRGRELRQPASVSLALPGVFCALSDGNDGCTSFTHTTGGSGSQERELLVNAGGVEANLLTAHWVDLRMVQQRGWVHQGDLLLYVISKLDYVEQFLRPGIESPPTVTDGNDIANYVTGLQDRFNRPSAADRQQIARRLRLAYAWNLADPMLAYSFYAMFAHGVSRGERWSQAPLPTLGKYDVYVAPRFGLSPFGAEHYVDVMIGRDHAALALYGRAGSSGLASYTGAGARAVGVRLGSRLALGGELDVWSQPQTLLSDRAVYERPQNRGVNAGFTADVRVVKNIGLTARLAYKTRGFLTGQPLEEGVYGYFGATIAFDPLR